MKKINLSNKKSSYMETERIYSKFKPHLMKVSIFILIFTVIISVIIILQYNPTRSEINAPDTVSPPGWYQQNLDVNIGSTGISDLLFIDSLLGFATTSNGSPNDTGYVIKTTNGGDNWHLVYRDMKDFSKVVFINKDTGFVCGGYGTGAVLLKTTNQGVNWFNLNIPGGGLINFYDMSVMNEDTIWVTETNPLVGGIFSTTNGGASWQKMDNGITGNYPDKLYFYNSNIGFASDGPYGDLFKTTNGGINWFVITSSNGFMDIYFFNENTGYKSNGYIRKTTNGGVNWVTQNLPILHFSVFQRLCVINKDTMWGTGGTLVINNRYKNVIYNTTNGGLTWGYQIPTSDSLMSQYYQIKFTDKLHGWAYGNSFGGVHTIRGGNDSTIITNIPGQNIELPNSIELKQNYPNPFNSKTIIVYELKKAGIVSLKLFDINGKYIATLINKNLNAGSYNVTVDAEKYNLSSGIYFYKLEFTDFKNITYSKTKAMIYLK